MSKNPLTNQVAKRALDKLNAIDETPKGAAHPIYAVYHDGKQGEAALLESAYRTSLNLASENKCASVAFPAISTGIFGFPRQRAAAVILTILGLAHVATESMMAIARNMR